MLELLQKNPRVDQWKASKQVCQFLFGARMKQSTIQAFVENGVDGYALLVMDKEQLAEMVDDATEGELARLSAELERLKTVWVKVLKQKGLLEECQEVLEELGIQDAT